MEIQVKKKIDEAYALCVVLFDDQDKYLEERKWHITTHGYAATGKKSVFMHRIVMGCVDKGRRVYIDHINGNRLDNRRCNLRLATASQNGMNRKNTHSRAFKGIARDCGRWRAQIRANGKVVNLGRFSSQGEAARRYDQAAVLYFGEYARLNFPNEALVDLYG